MPTLSRILHIAHGIPSYHNSLVELANRLRQSDIELITVSHNDLSEVLGAQNHTFILLTADAQLEDQRQAAMAVYKQRRGPARWVGQYVQSARFRKQSLQTSEISELVTLWKPDLLLIDMECHKAIIQAHGQSLPIVLLSRWYSVFRQGDNPPMHTLQMPAKGMEDILRIRWSWLRLAWYKRWLSVQHSFSRQRFKPVTYATNARPALKALAKAQGLKPLTLTDTSHWLIPHVYRQLPVMSLTHESLEFSADNDPRVNYVGAMVGERDAYHPGYDNAMERLQSFLDKRKGKNNPLVYCSLSTFWNTEQDILASVIGLFAERQDLDLVMGLGGRQPSSSWPDITDNMLLLDYAPQLAVLKHASVAITHGGVSTINEALVNGVPLIVCSSGHVDQNGCTARVVHSGVGVSCSADPLDIVELDGQIIFILGGCGEKIRKNVKELQALQRRTQNEVLAVEFLRTAGPMALSSEHSS